MTAATNGHGASKAPRLVFVVPVHDEAENLPRLLADFQARPQLLSDAGRLIVVDDGSADGTPALVHAYRGRCRSSSSGSRQPRPRRGIPDGFASALAAPRERPRRDPGGGHDERPRSAAADARRARRGADVVLADWRMVGVELPPPVLSAAPGWSCALRSGCRRTPSPRSSGSTGRRPCRRRSAVRRRLRSASAASRARRRSSASSSAMGARIVEVPVPLDWSRRNGESKMPVCRTMLAYWRMLVRGRGAPGDPRCCAGAYSAMTRRRSSAAASSG